MYYMNKIYICLQCAFNLNIENNSDYVVMSLYSDKLTERCVQCAARIGTSGLLHQLLGVYHTKRHENNYVTFSKDLPERFHHFMKNRYNGDTLNCFIMAIKDQNYPEGTVRKYFELLVTNSDSDMYNKQKLVQELVMMSKLKGGSK